MGAVVVLVYARADPGSPEPLIAVCDTTERAREIEETLDRERPGVRVMWETHEIDAPTNEVREVYVVFLSPSVHHGTKEPLDPIGIAVFARHDEAVADMARRRAAEAVPHYEVRALPVGWRRPGWPFAEGAPPTG